MKFYIEKNTHNNPKIIEKIKNYEESKKQKKYEIQEVYKFGVKKKFKVDLNKN